MDCCRHLHKIKSAGESLMYFHFSFEKFACYFDICKLKQFHNFYYKAKKIRIFNY